MSRPALAGCAVALASLVAPIASAQAPGVEAVSLDEVIRIARERSPAAGALRARVAVADADVALAGVYPNPELGYAFMGRFDGTNQSINGSQHQAWVDFPLLIAGQHDARRAAAAGDAQVARAELDLDLLALEVEVRSAFVSLLAAQDRAARLGAARQELDELVRIVGERTSAGAQSRYDEARIGLEIARVDNELATAGADIVAARARLAARVGWPGWQPHAAGSLESLHIELPRAAELPAVRAMQRRVEAAELDVSRAERERVPEIRFGIGTYLTSDPDSASVYAGISVPLPIFDNGDAAVGRARAARDAAAEARDAMETEARARLSGLLAALRARRDALEQFDAQTLSRLPEIQEMAAASYRLGASGVFELLDTFRARFELELQRIELLARVLETETELVGVTGR